MPQDARGTPKFPAHRPTATELAALIPDAKVEGMAVEVRPVMFSDGLLEM